MYGVRRTGIVLLLVSGVVGCNPADTPPLTTGTAAERGQLLLQQYPCAQCHRIRGVANATGNIGPPLDRVARRVYLAGVLPNTPDNLVRWIRHPRHIDPLTAMPDLQVNEADARAMAAYLMSLE